MRAAKISLILAFASLSACQTATTNGSASHEGANIGATAQLVSSTGVPVGKATLTQVADGLLLRVEAQTLSPGLHGIHLHSVGKCEGPKFESSGGHWNPMARQHGLENPMGTHSGDMPNLEASASGTAAYSYTIKGASLEGGPLAVLDADGTSVIIHAKADDNKTDPSGNSGDRLDCGVFAKA